MTSATELTRQAEQAQAAFEAEHGKLFRGDGEKRYSEKEHAEREGVIKRQRNEGLKEIEEQATELLLEAGKEHEEAASFAPDSVLTSEERKSVMERKELIADDVAALSEFELASRLRKVLSGGDRAEQYAYLQAAKRRQREVLERRRGELRERSMPERLAKGNGELEDGIRALDKSLVDPERVRRAESAASAEREYAKVQQLAWSLQRTFSGRDVGAVHSATANYARPGR